MPSEQHVRVALIDIDTGPTSALRFVTDGSFDLILSTMGVAVSEGAFVEGQMLFWDSTSEWK